MEETVRLKKELERMLESRDLDSEHVGTALDGLAKVAMTTELLKRTMVGRTVNNVRKEAAGEAKTKAKQLLDNWKSLMGALLRGWPYGLAGASRGWTLCTVAERGNTKAGHKERSTAQTKGKHAQG